MTHAPLSNCREGGSASGAAGAASARPSAVGPARGPTDRRRDDRPGGPTSSAVADTPASRRDRSPATPSIPEPAYYAGRRGERGYSRATAAPTRRNRGDRG